MAARKSGGVENPRGAPRVFISYSNDSTAHRDWVRVLAERLERGGVEVRLDQWHLVPGESVPAFMAREVRAAQYCIAVLTPRYAQRADADEGGAGQEHQIITGENG